MDNDIFRSSWLEAKRSCEKKGMMLLSNFDESTMRMVVRHYLELGSDMGDVIFIGLHRDQQVSFVIIAGIEILMFAKMYSYLKLLLITHLCQCYLSSRLMILRNFVIVRSGFMSCNPSDCTS